MCRSKPPVRSRRPPAARSRRSRTMWNGEEPPEPMARQRVDSRFDHAQGRVGAEQGVDDAGPRSARLFNGTVRLPGGSYAAYYSAFPDGEYWTNDDGKPQSRKWHWFGDERIEDFKLIVRGNGQRLAAAEVERLRQAADASAVVALHAGSGELFQQAGFSLSKPTDVEIRADRRSPRGRRVRLRLDHQRRHAREGVEADVARLGAGRWRRQEPRGGAHPDAAAGTVRGLLRDRRHPRSV